MRGMSYYTTSSGIPVLRYHYSASPRKDRDTPEGQAWFEEEIKGYEGGEDGVAWQQEMEINPHVRNATRVWPNFDEMMSYVTIADIPIEEHWPVYLGYDYGPKEPSVFVVLAFESESKFYQIDELWMKDTPIMRQYEILRSKPYFDRIQWPVWADPSIWSASQQKDEEVTSIGDLWRDEYGVEMGRGQAFIGVDAAFIGLLNSVLWADKIAPRFQIFESCTKTLQELRTLAWREPPINSQEKQRDMKIAGKNVHCFDALKYPTLEVWKGAASAELPMPEGCIEWAISRMAAKAGMSKYNLNAGGRK